MAKKKDARVYSQVDNSAVKSLLGGLKLGAAKDSKSMINCIKLKRCLAKNEGELMEAREAIAKEYDLKNEKGLVSWEGHEKADEIQKKMSSLEVQEVKIEPINFMTEGDFFSMITEDYEINQIDYLETVLVKQAKK